MVKAMTLPQRHALADMLDELLPKPWRAVPNDPPGPGPVRSFRVEAADGGLVCVVERAGLGLEPLQMLADRIAALPRLVEAARQGQAALPDAWFAVECDVPREVVEMLDVAIRAARGLPPAED